MDIAYGNCVRKAMLVGFRGRPLMLRGANRDGTYIANPLDASVDFAHTYVSFDYAEVMRMCSRALALCVLTCAPPGAIQTLHRL